MARPSKYNEKIADEICERIADDEALSVICKDEKMPCYATVKNWLRSDKHSSFLAKVARARTEQADTIHEKIKVVENMLLSGEIEPNAARTLIQIYESRAKVMNPARYNPANKVEQDTNIKIDVVQYLPEKCINRDTPKLIRDTSENS